MGKAPRNKTIDTSVSEGKTYLGRCVHLTQPQSSLADVLDKTIIGDMLRVCQLLPAECADLIVADPPYNLTKTFSGTTFAKKKASETTEEYQKRVEAKVGLCSEEILHIRDSYPESSLADLYDPLTMPPDLLKAHKALDKAVMELYGYAPDMSEPEIVADLMVRYQKLVEAEKSKVSSPNRKG